MANVPTPATDEEMETITSADGTEIAFERTGSGPPLALVHGSTADHTTWEVVLPTFEEHVTAYAMDRRGHGASGDAAAYDLEREVEDVVAVLDSIGKSVTLLGHSYGALCTLEAARRTDNLRNLILYEPPISVGDHEFATEDVCVEMKALLDGGENEQAVVLALEEVAKIRPSLIEMLRAAPDWQDRVDAAQTAYREVQAIAEYEFDAGRFADVATPTVLLTGSESPPRYRAATEAANNALSNSRIVTFDEQDHVVHYTAPDRFINKVLAVALESN